MSESRPVSETAWTDPDDAPEWTDAMFDAAEFAIGGKVVRAARERPPAIDVSRFGPPPRGISGVYAMAGKKTTSPKAAKSASKVLKDGRTSKDSKTAAGSALSQREKAKKKK